jgi:hypothetical protein
LTLEQRRSALKCATTLQRKTHTALALSEQEMWHSWQSVEENDFFYAAPPPLYRGMPRLWPMHADRARGPVYSAGVYKWADAYKVEFRQNYELNHGAPARQQLLQVQKRRENDRISVIAIQQQQQLLA